MERSSHYKWISGPRFDEAKAVKVCRILSHNHSSIEITRRKLAARVYGGESNQHWPPHYSLLLVHKAAAALRIHWLDPRTPAGRLKADIG